MKKWLTLLNVRELTGLKIATIQDLVDQGYFRVQKRHGLIVIDHVELAEWMQLDERDEWWDPTFRDDPFMGARLSPNKPKGSD